MRMIIEGGIKKRTETNIELEERNVSKVFANVFLFRHTIKC